MPKVIANANVSYYGKFKGPSYSQVRPLAKRGYVSTKSCYNLSSGEHQCNRQVNNKNALTDWCETDHGLIW